MAEDDVISGWLSKKLTKAKKWKKCWYVLDLTNMQNASLAHYEHSTMMRDDAGADRLAPGERQIIPLENITSVQYADKGGTTFAIHLKTNSVVHLKAINEDVARKWVNGIKHGLDLLTAAQAKTLKKGKSHAVLPQTLNEPTNAPIDDFSPYGTYVNSDIQKTLTRPKKKKKAPKKEIEEKEDDNDNEKKDDEEMFEELPLPPPSNTPKPLPARVGTAVEATAIREIRTIGAGQPASRPSPSLQIAKDKQFNSMNIPNAKGTKNAPRNAVLPVLADRTGGEHSAQSKLKTPEIVAMLRNTLEHSTSLAHLLFADLDEEAVEQMVQAMYRVEVKAKQDVVTQGEAGSQFYVVESGKFHVYLTVTFNDEKLRFVAGVPQLIANKGPRTFFGELALLYEQPSPVTVRAVTDGILWAVSRQEFHNITKRSAMKQQKEKLKLLTSVAMLRDMLSETDLVALADALESMTYNKDEVMVDMGADATNVIFVAKGEIGLFDGERAGMIDKLVPGDSYGTLALLESYKVAHQLVALTDKVTVLSLDISEVQGIVGPLRDALKKKFEEAPDYQQKIMEEVAKNDKHLDKISAEAAVKLTIQHFQKTLVDNNVKGTILGTQTSAHEETVGSDGLPSIDKPWDSAPAIMPNIQFRDDLKPIKHLGSGNFGHVYLVKNMRKNLSVIIAGDQEPAPDHFALKVLSREFIVGNGWEQMAENEKSAMSELSYYAKSPFIIRLFHSFACRKNIYLLLELCDGGDLYAIVKRSPGQRLNEKHARFYVAGVVKGLEAMHQRFIIYRDLKPENLMLDRTGYPKIGDFGLAKKTLRTFTVCGTPDYMAPETIRSKGHDKGVDWWAVGVLIYEITTGTTPFFGNEPMDIYEAILAHRTLLLPQDATVTAACSNLMDSLLQPKRTKRLGNLREGAQGVIDHDFFKGFAWDQFVKRSMKPPIKKKPQDFKDTNSFDPEFDQQLDDLSDWIPNVDTILKSTPRYP